MKTVAITDTITITLPALVGDEDGKGEAARALVIAKIAEMVAAESAQFAPHMAKVARGIEACASKLTKPMSWRIFSSDADREDMAYRMIDTAMSAR